MNRPRLGELFHGERIRARRLRAALLGCALLLTQWLTFAHAVEHPALSQDKACAVCVMGLNLDGGMPLPALPTIAYWFPTELPPPQAAADAASAGLPTARARGPPVSSS
ncbi:MAG: hypothetical protein JWQ90_4593 [Hydrocarboniphaga sp.]|uniref:hypothetical protein n=1 Tax=Hydrocarboniphaga sp. TaxID=2033016 RepID=UPI0026352F0F|nr:hypothetical protein [Hydrocarboniphaga sp.]MDB5972143.1 hypothetical protein [Hydrocarboniphaga sp.]